MLEIKTTYYERESMFHGFIPHVMGTRFDILLICPDLIQLNNTIDTLAGELERLDKMLNRFNPESEVARVNAQYSRLPVGVSDELWAILLLCRGYYEKTLCLFDVTLKDFSQVNFHDDQRISFSQKGMSFDFGGFAKGYALKKIKEILLSGNIKHAFVDFGGSSILTMGHHPYGNCWKVSFTSPYDHQLNLREFDLGDTALSVSGNTQQYSRHIINPLTGIYNEQWKATAIVSDNPLDAEVLSTVWMIADKKQQEQINMNFKGIQGTIYTL